MNSFNFFSGLSVSSSLALLSLLTIAIPIMIHMINPAKGKLVYIGRIAFLKKAAVSRLLELNIKQWLLLICRILLLTFIALLMAHLLFDKPPEKINQSRTYVTQGWVLNASDDELVAFVESNQNADLYWLNDSLSLISKANNHKLEQLSSLKQAMKKQAEQKKQQLKQNNVYHFIKQLDQKIMLDSNSNSNSNSNSDSKPAIVRLILTNQSINWPLNKPQLNNPYDWQIKNIESDESRTITIDVFSDNSQQAQRDLNLFKHAISINKNFKVRYFSMDAFSIVKELAPWIVIFDEQRNSNNKEQESEMISQLLGKVSQGHYLLSSFALTEQLSSSERHHAIIKSEQIFGQGKLFTLKQSLSKLPSEIIETEWLAVYLLELLKSQSREQQMISLSQSELNAMSSYQNNSTDNYNQSNSQSNSQSSEQNSKQSLQSWLILLIGLFWMLERILAEYKQPLTKPKSELQTNSIFEEQAASHD